MRYYITARRWWKVPNNNVVAVGFVGGVESQDGLYRLLAVASMTKQLELYSFKKSASRFIRLEEQAKGEGK